LDTATGWADEVCLSRFLSPHHPDCYPLESISGPALSQQGPYSSSVPKGTTARAYGTFSQTSVSLECTQETMSQEPDNLRESQLIQQETFGKNPNKADGCDVGRAESDGAFYSQSSAETLSQTGPNSQTRLGSQLSTQDLDFRSFTLDQFRHVC
jgi:hypothetical protein